jgi:hypothetical protein
MSASKYKIWAIGAPVAEGVSGSIHVGMATVAKKANGTEPNIVINELFCNLLARGLFLPCPPGALIENANEDYFCSLNFNLAGQSLPPSPIPVVVANCPVLCWGVLLFDVLVMNPDRHNKNLSYDRTNRRIQIFDHSRAFLPIKTTIESAIADNTGKLGFQAHCLKLEISTMDGFDFWVARIKALPDYFIEEAVSEICAIGYPNDKKSLTIDFIRSRRNSIDTIIQNNIAEFPKLSQPAARIPPPPPVVTAVPAAVAVQRPPSQPGQVK